VAQGQHQFTGQAIGINEQGHLLIKLPDKTIKECSSGDTSVIKEP